MATVEDARRVEVITCYDFKSRPDLLVKALTAAGVSLDDWDGNRKLAQFGTGLTEFIFNYLAFVAQVTRDDTTDFKKSLSNNKRRAEVAERTGIDRCVKCSELPGGRAASVFAKAVNAIIGAVFIDSEGDILEVIRVMQRLGIFAQTYQTINPDTLPLYEMSSLSDLRFFATTLFSGRCEGSSSLGTNDATHLPNGLNSGTASSEGTVRGEEYDNDFLVLTVNGEQPLELSEGGDGVDEFDIDTFVEGFSPSETQNHDMERDGHNDDMERSHLNNDTERDSHNDEMGLYSHNDEMQRDGHNDDMERNSHNNEMVLYTRNDEIERDSHNDNTERNHLNNGMEQNNHNDEMQLYSPNNVMERNSRALPTNDEYDDAQMHQRARKKRKISRVTEPGENEQVLTCSSLRDKDGTLDKYFSEEAEKCKAVGDALPQETFFPPAFQAAILELGKEKQETVIRFSAYIASPHVIAALREILERTRLPGDYFPTWPGGQMSKKERFDLIDRLAGDISYSQLLRRYHVLQLFRECGGSASSSRGGMVLMTLENFGSMSARPGNPMNRSKAGVIAKMMEEIFPDLQEGSPEYKTKYRTTKSLRKLGQRLDILEKRFGEGTLGLILDHGLTGYLDVGISDQMIFDLTEAGFNKFIDLLDSFQGHTLRCYSLAIFPVVRALTVGPVPGDGTLALEGVQLGDIMKYPKGSEELLDLISGTTSRRLLIEAQNQCGSDRQ